MTVDRETLLALSKDDLIALILAQHAQVEALTARITELKAKLNAPPKTPDNSSTPSSKAQKPNLPERPKKPRRGRPGACRTLAANPDRIIEATLGACPHCDHALGAADQPDIRKRCRGDLLSWAPVLSPGYCG